MFHFGGDFHHVPTPEPAVNPVGHTSLVLNKGRASFSVKLNRREPTASCHLTYTRYVACGCGKLHFS